MKKFITLAWLLFAAFGIAEPYRDSRGVLFMNEDEWVKFYNKGWTGYCGVSCNWFYDYGRKLFERWKKNDAYS